MDGSISFLNEYSNFPTNPNNREMAVVNGILYFYTTIRGVQTWYPLSNAKASKVHIQGAQSAVWVVNHDFNTDNLGIFVYDELNNLQMVSPKNMTDSSFEIHFTTPKTGKVVVFFDATMDIPAIVDLQSDIDLLVQEINNLKAGIEGGEITPIVQWVDVIGKPNVVYQAPIPADQFTSAEVLNLRSGKLANGGSVASVMNRSSVQMFDSATNPDQIFDFQYLDFFIMVYVNRLLLRSTEYVAANGTDITITIPLVDGDEVEFISLSQD
jgi:hypothetical protein